MLAKSRKILNEQVPQSMAGLRVQFSSQVLKFKKRHIIRSYVESSNQHLQLVDHQNDFGSFSFQPKSLSFGI